MATPQQNAQALQAFWKSMAISSHAYEVLAAGGGMITGAFDHMSRIANAQITMKELVAQCVADPMTRVGVFAGNSIFETALLTQDGQLTSILLGAARAGRMDTTSMLPIAKGDGLKMRSPRQIMLDGIYAAGTAGVFTIKDPSGMTSWLKSTLVATAACIATIKGDPDAGVRAAMLKLLRDVAIPEELARGLKADRTFEGLVELLPGVAFDRTTRVTIQALGAEADARVTQDLARLPDLGALAAFPTGDGAFAPTFPPALAWYRRPGYWITSGASVIAGGLVAARRSTR